MIKKYIRNIRQIIKGKQNGMIKKLEKTVYIYLKNGVKRDKGNLINVNT